MDISSTFAVDALLMPFLRVLEYFFKDTISAQQNQAALVATFVVWLRNFFNR